MESLNEGGNMARTYNYSSADDDVRLLLSLVTDAVTDDTTVDYFIEKADNYIDARLARRYDVPFTQSTAPPILTDISANLAASRKNGLLYSLASLDTF